MSIFMLLVVASCDDSDDNGDITDGDMDMEKDTVDGDMAEADDADGDEDTAIDVAKVRVIHFSPDAPAVDVIANGVITAFESVEFMDATSFMEVPPGTYDFAVVPAGGEVADAVFEIEGLELEKDTYYSAVAYKALADIAVLALVNDMTPPGDGNFKFRAIHTANGVGEVDIWSVPAEGDAVMIYENVELGGVGEYLELPSGAYTIGVDVDDDATPDLLFETPPIPATAILDVFAVNDGTNVYLAAVDPTGAVIKIDAIAAEEKASIRAIHLSPDAPAVDVYVNAETKAFADLMYEESTVYAELDPGTYTIDVTAKDDTVENSVLQVADLMLEVDKYYTAVAYKMLAGIEALLLEDDMSEVMAGKIRVRAIHAADGVGEVDIWNVSDMENPTMLYENVALGAVGDYAELDAGAYALGFDVDDDAMPDLVYQLPALDAGAIVNIFALKDGDDVYLLAQLGDGTTVKIMPAAMVRALHLSPDAPGVDIYMDGETMAVEDLMFAEGTEYLNIPAGDHTFEVTATGGTVGDAVLNIPSMTYAVNGMYTAVAFDELASIQGLALTDDYTPPAAGTIKIRAIHAAVGVPPAAIWSIGGAKVAATKLYDTPLAFGDVEEYLEVAAGSYTLGFDIDDDDVPDALFITPELAEGTVANIFAVTDSDADLFLLVQLKNGDLVKVEQVAGLKLLHLSPDAGAVDLKINGTIDIANGVNFKQGLSNYIALPPGSHIINVYPTGDTTALLDIPVTLESKKIYTAYVYGLAADSSVTANIVEDMQMVDEASKIALRAIHAAAGVGEVDIYVYTGPREDYTMLWEDVSYEGVGEYLKVDSGMSHSIAFDTDNDTSSYELMFNIPSQSEGAIANVFAIKEGSSIYLVVQFVSGALMQLNPLI